MRRVLGRGDSDAVASAVQIALQGSPQRPIWFTLTITFATPWSNPALEAFDVRHEEVVADQLGCGDHQLVIAFPGAHFVLASPSSIDETTIGR